MRGNSHVRFGGRRRGDHRPKGRHRRLAADPAPAPSRCAAAVTRKEHSRLTAHCMPGEPRQHLAWMGWTYTFV